MLKEQILDLLEKDREFRYAVAGLIGMQEILQRLDRHEEIMQKMLERLDRHEEIMQKMLERLDRHEEIIQKILERLERHEEIMQKMLERLDRHEEAIKRLWENQNRLWEEVKALRENQEKLWENQNRLWLEVKELREGQKRLERELQNTRNYMMRGFREIKSSLRKSFHGSAAAFVEFLLAEMGYDASVDRKIFVQENEPVEIDLFCERPLVVGEVTLKIESEEEAKKELEKLMKKVRIAERIFGKPEFIFLVVANAGKEAEELLRKICGEKGIRPVLGKEIEEF
jgi:ABC-type dipeptide/oligopeptide/nickel transport system ATPase component